MPKIIDDEKVYRAAMQAVIERGYAGATTKQIAEAAGCTDRTVREWCKRWVENRSIEDLPRPEVPRRFSV